MHTTTTTHGGFRHHRLSDIDTIKARDDHRVNSQRVLETFTKTHGCSSDNLVSDTSNEIVSSFTPNFVVRAWPDLVTAQAWADFILAGNLEQGLEFPPLIIDSQVDSE